MNNHLIPEQRLDKNGRLNTKHVRATKVQASVSKVSPPVLPSPTRKLTPGQTTPVTGTLEVTNETGDKELCGNLGVRASSPTALIHASYEEIYSLLSVTSNGNAHALLRAGHRTAEEALSYLNENGFSHLIQDRSEICEEALSRRIAPRKFITASERLPPAAGSEHYMDAVEVYSSSYIMDGRKFANNVYDGTVRNEDMKEIGYKEIGTSRDVEAVRQALRSIASKKVTHTAADIKALMDKYPRDFRDAFKLSERYGVDLTLSINGINLEYAAYLENRSTPKERIISLLKYSDLVSDYEFANLIYKEPMPHHKVEKYHDSGIEISHAANDDCTEQQLDAIIAGMAPGVSGGWL